MKKTSTTNKKHQQGTTVTNSLSMFRLSILVVGLAIFVGGTNMMKISTFIDFPAAKPSDTDTMMAISYNEHGDPFVLKMNMRYPRPVPRDDQVLVQIHFTSLNPAVSINNKKEILMDCMYRLKKTPKVLTCPFSLVSFAGTLKRTTNFVEMMDRDKIFSSQNQKFQGVMWRGLLLMSVPIPNLVSVIEWQLSFHWSDHGGDRLQSM
jgi:hypothetical protein